MILSRITTIVLATLLMAGTAAAQQSEECLRTVDEFNVSFSIFQAAYGNKAFCDDAPTTGVTAMTVDFGDPALRKMPTEVRLIEAQSWGDAQDPEADAAGKPIKQLPAKTHADGLVVMEHNFATPGYFVEIVSIQSPTGTKHVLRFPFKIGQGAGLQMSVYEIGAVVGILAMVLSIFIWVQRRNRQQTIEL
jgi:hypothetical protein